MGRADAVNGLPLQARAESVAVHVVLPIAAAFTLAWASSYISDNAPVVVFFLAYWGSVTVLRKWWLARWFA